MTIPSSSLNNNASEQLAGFCANLRFEDIPADVIAHIKLSILDGLGCCLVGSTLPWTRKVRDMIDAEDAAPIASLLGSSDKVSLSGAILVNATAGHAFELDDIHREAILHPNSIAVPVALNTAQFLGRASGKDILTAIIAGYEVGNRVGAAAGTDLLLRGFHPQGAVGPFCGAATASNMMRLNADKTRDALGIAGSFGSGLMAAQEGAMVKRLHSGHAAEAGVRGALLAKRGFTGISDVVEAEYGGFLSTFSGGVNIERATAGLGSTWETLATGFKPHATVTSIHSALDALGMIMRDNNLVVGDIAHIHAGVSHPTHVHCAWPYKAQSITAAQMNIYYGLAMIALFGVAFVQQFDANKISDPDVMAFTKCITASVDPDIEARGHAFRHMARVRVETADGQTFEREVTHRRGSPENPISPADVIAKFRTLAASVLTPDATNDVITIVDTLDDQQDISALMQALTP
jgi:2-methylcitrate dehydratase PrpD